jgi:hypothetical protein
MEPCPRQRKDELLMGSDTVILYKSMGLWTEVEVTTQSFQGGDARAYLVVRPTSPEERPKGLDADDSKPITILLNRANMRRLALHLLMESMG